VSGDPVSWLVVEPGWEVVDAAGEPVGAVAEVLGEPDNDIFDGLAVAGSVLEQRRYVPAEVVGEITQGTIRLTVGKRELEEIEERVEPPGGSV
jgi:ribosomal 30S subunit maturation factor RimM